MLFDPRRVRRCARHSITAAVLVLAAVAVAGVAMTAGGPVTASQLLAAAWEVLLALACHGLVVAVGLALSRRGRSDA
jgi:hypothetical protein